MSYTIFCQHTSACWITRLLNMRNLLCQANLAHYVQMLLELHQPSSLAIHIAQDRVLLLRTNAVFKTSFKTMKRHNLNRGNLIIWVLHLITVLTKIRNLVEVVLSSVRFVANQAMVLRNVSSLENCCLARQVHHHQQLLLLMKLHQLFFMTILVLLIGY